MPATNATAIHFHAGHNDAGYLPESDVETFSSFEDAKRYMIQELLWAADSMASWADEHDCDDVPCPTYGDECPEQLASSVTLAAEDLNLESGPEWQTYLSDGRSLPVSWWIAPCSEDDCGPEPEDAPVPTHEGPDGEDVPCFDCAPVVADEPCGTFLSAGPGPLGDHEHSLFCRTCGWERAEHGDDGRLPQRYGITATVERTVDGWHSVTQVPSFFLDANVQGIGSEAHAEAVARNILTAAAGAGATLHISAVAL